MVEDRYEVPAGTLPLLAGILEMMDFTHRNMMELIADLPVAALIWRPTNEMGSLAGIVRHTMYCAVYALHCAAGEDTPFEEAENTTPWDVTDDAAKLIACIHEGDTLMKRVLPAMTVEKMAMRYPAWGQGTLTLSGALIAEAAIHTGMHWGHMQMTRQLWEQANPEFVGSYTRW